jgi:two-component system OmpR family sensor kinase
VRAESVDAIDRESQRMARLTADLLALLHTEEGLTYQSVRFDINALVRERIAVTASKWIDKDLEFEGPEEEELVMVGDPNRVEDVLSILLDNAAKYTPEQGRVAVCTRRKKEFICFEVADSGQGIPAEDLPHIFERFYRSEVSRTSSAGGFGLGLAIAKGIVEGTGGSIEVDSEMGVGTTFTVRLPRGRVGAQV